MKVAGYKQLCT